MKMWYTEEARQWEESIPIGNGSFGGMIWGGIETEKIGLNEETLWSGYYYDKNNPKAFPALDKVRELIFNRKVEEAEELIKENMLGEYGESYLPLGNLILKVNHNGEISNYHRELDINRAIATVSYEVSGSKYEREYFCSKPSQALFGRLTGKELEVVIGFESQLMVDVKAKENGLVIEGQCPEHVDPNYIGEKDDAIIQGTKGQVFQGQIEILFCDGIVEVQQKDNSKLHIKQATEVVFMVSCVKKPNYKKTSSFEEIKEEHIADYQRLFNRVDIYLGEQIDLPTNQRLEDLRNGKEDNGLYGLYFQYGRYLLIASSREGSLPANLQGIWNWNLRAPWSSNWTVNINTQMNYWLAQNCNLRECLSPYFDYVKKLSVEGKKTAKIHYNCRGFVQHHNADYWCNTNPVGIAFGEEKGWDGTVSWSMWPMGGAWLIQEFYKDYEYNKDEEFLRRETYPILRETALFLHDWLILKDGEYVTCPSTSPENTYFSDNGKAVSATYASAMDLELIREVFGHFKKTCEVLHIEDDLLVQIQERLDKLAPFKVGSYGQLLEWAEEFKECEPGHRHISHLYGLFPSELFENNAELKEACRKSLQHRLAHGGGYTGWSCAWIINMFAILEDSEQAYQFLKTLLTRSTYHNLWDAHPPFQIDGNFGGTAAIANMLVQDRGGNLKVLPALPKQFKDGYVRGLRIKDKKTIDIEWKDSVLKEYHIYETEEEN